MKKGLIISAAVYFVLISSIAAVKVIKGDEAYYNYKKNIKAAQKELNLSEKDSKPVISNNSGNTNGSSQPSTNTSEKPQNNAGNTPNSNNTQNTYAEVKFTRQLSQGKTGDDVKKLQYILKEKGFYKGEISGSFDKNTFNALVEFQKDKNLKPADGILGPTTWKTMER